MSVQRAPIDAGRYLDLLRETMPRVIHSKEENEKYIALLEVMYQNVELSPEEMELADLLTLLIEDFEEKHYELTRATPVQVLSELMEANDLKQKDLVDVFGSPSIVSEVLSEKRQLSKEHIRNLSKRFNVSPELFF
jgi:HTH-type transcriptional regulator/antitoxin HigA